MTEVTPQEADNVIRLAWPIRHTHEGCTGACDRGMLPCQTPDACFRPEEQSRWEPAPVHRALIVAIYAASALLAIYVSIYIWTELQ